MMESGLGLALTGSAVTAFSTSFGALPVLAARRVGETTQDTLMGFSAGVMLAASSFSLLIPALEMVSEDGPGKLAASLAVGAAVLAGAAFLHACNRFMPHEHFFTGREGGPSGTRLKRIWLFVLAIALHNFPEGLAVGTGVGSQDPAVAVPILVGIGLQDLPEGFVVAMALVTAKYRAIHAIGVAAVTGLVEAGAALLGYFAMTAMTNLLPWALASAAGAMLYVVSDEIIPESHHKEHAPYATGGLMVGFVLMMILDVALS